MRLQQQKGKQGESLQTHIQIIKSKSWLFVQNNRKTKIGGKQMSINNPFDIPDLDGHRVESVGNFLRLLSQANPHGTSQKAKGPFGFLGSLETQGVPRWMIEEIVESVKKVFDGLRTISNALQEHDVSGDVSIHYHNDPAAEGNLRLSSRVDVVLTTPTGTELSLRNEADPVEILRAWLRGHEVNPKTRKTVLDGLKQVCANLDEVGTFMSTTNFALCTEVSVTWTELFAPNPSPSFAARTRAFKINVQADGPRVDSGGQTGW